MASSCSSSSSYLTPAAPSTIDVMHRLPDGTYPFLHVVTKPNTQFLSVHGLKKQGEGVSTRVQVPEETIFNPMEKKIFERTSGQVVVLNDNNTVLHASKNPVAPYKARSLQFVGAGAFENFGFHQKLEGLPSVDNRYEISPKGLTRGSAESLGFSFMCDRRDGSFYAKSNSHVKVFVYDGPNVGRRHNEPYSCLDSELYTSIFSAPRFNSKLDNLFKSKEDFLNAVKIEEAFLRSLVVVSLSLMPECPSLPPGHVLDERPVQNLPLWLVFQPESAILLFRQKRCFFFGESPNAPQGVLVRCRACFAGDQMTGSGLCNRCYQSARTRLRQFIKKDGFHPGGTHITRQEIFDRLAQNPPQNVSFEDFIAKLIDKQLKCIERIKTEPRTNSLLLPHVSLPFSSFDWNIQELPCLYMREVFLLEILDYVSIKRRKHDPCPTMNCLISHQKEHCGDILTCPVSSHLIMDDINCESCRILRVVQVVDLPSFINQGAVGVPPQQLDGLFSMHMVAADSNNFDGDEDQLDSTTEVIPAKVFLNGQPVGGLTSSTVNGFENIAPILLNGGLTSSVTLSSATEFHQMTQGKKEMQRTEEAEKEQSHRRMSP